MKKGIVGVLILVAVIVLVSPAIVGRLAKNSMDENLNWAAREAGGVNVTSQGFARGWFYSEGRHRVAFEDGQVLTAIKAMGIGADPDELPELIISTRIDHGLIPVTSMGREKGSLVPGLGNAVSTVQVELAGGETIDVPGTIYSNVSLGGEMNSTYALEPGSYVEDGVSASWGETMIRVATSPSNGEVEFDGTVGLLAVGDDSEGLSIGSLAFEGNQTPTTYGFATGNISFTLTDMSVTQAGMAGAAIQSMSATATTELDDDRVGGAATMAFEMRGIPNVGDVTVDMDFRLANADAESLGRIQERLESVTAASPDPDPTMLYGVIEADLKAFFASGFELEFERLDVTLPQGTVSTRMKFSFGEEDPATFEWPALLLSTEASIDVSIPADLVDAMTEANPQAAIAIGGGYLVKNGDAYEMKARLKKGLATINGAPIPIPLGGM